MEDINEKSTAFVVVDFFGEDGLPAAPVTLSYRIDDVHTGAAVRAITALAPSPSVEIKLTPEDTTIINAMRENEVKRVTIVAGYGIGDGFQDQFDVRVKNLGFVA